MTDNNNIIFSNITSDGHVQDVRTLTREDLLRCPFSILMPEHYRDDGTCKCSDPDHIRDIMMAEWGYTINDFIQAGIQMTGADN